jgi:DNA invertase Pin-like site-specific DNA recombinase
VLAIEASRLARNGRDWHTLIEFCGLVGTIIVDEDGIYDPRHPNDRLLLGMKGTMRELELSLFPQRSQEALRQKARRGALFLGVAAGYVKAGRDRIEKDPDRRGQGGRPAGLCQIHRAAECTAGACLAARGRHRLASQGT